MIARARQRLLNGGLVVSGLVSTTPISHAIPLLTPPPPQSNRSLPSLRRDRLCRPLQAALNARFSGRSSAWSVSILSPTGNLEGEINGDVPLVPASNQKLITTAFALDRLGPDFRLRTQLHRRSDGRLEISGQGDPDLGLIGVQRLAMAALGQGGGSAKPHTRVSLTLREEAHQTWWPSDWHPADRAEAYGAPVTRLALTSNALGRAISNPAARFMTLMQREIERQGGSVDLQMAQANRFQGQTVVLHEETSAPMHALMSLANAESHNFTAEVLLRQAADQWDTRLASRQALHWMRAQNLPVMGTRVADGSGLSRGNRVSSLTLAALLLRMDQHPLSAYYKASMAIAGRRGTLRNYYWGTPLEGRFLGKTGTLTGVRSVSGYLRTAGGPRYVSLISNGDQAADGTIAAVMQTVQRFSPCPSWT